MRRPWECASSRPRNQALLLAVLVFASDPQAAALALSSSPPGRSSRTRARPLPDTSFESERERRPAGCMLVASRPVE
eukprot:ctg_2635.g636